MNALTHDGAPRLAVLDWTMPRMEGPEVCQRLRDSQNVEEYTYVIFLTAKASVDDLAKAIAAGADDFITKPVKETDLRFRLANGKRMIDIRNQLTAAETELRRLKQEEIPIAPVQAPSANSGFLNRLLS